MNKLCAIRLSDTEEGVDRISDALRKTQLWRDDAKDLEQDLTRLATRRLSNIDALIFSCMRSESEDLEEKSEKANKELMDLRKTVRTLAGRAAKLKEGGLDKDQLNHHRDETEKLTRKRREQLQLILREPELTPTELLKRIDAAKPLWQEHIETLAGAVLRDVKFDEGLATLADRLIKACRQVFGTTETLNILGRDHAEPRDLAYALYLRFPTWSVWGLPLIAHDLWHASTKEWAAATRPPMIDHITKIRNGETLWKKPDVQDCLADAFATFVVGPAYALACILLELDPTNGKDRLRAEAVFFALEALQTKAGQEKSGGEAFFDFSALRECWNEASESGMAPPADWPETRGMILQFLRLMPDKLRYNTRDWTELTWLEELFAQKVPSEDRWPSSREKLDSLPNCDIRHFLYAGWLARWDDENQDSEHINELAKRVTRLCQEVPQYRPDMAAGAGGDPNAA